MSCTINDEDFKCLILVDGIDSDLSRLEILKEPFFSEKLLCLIRILSSFRLVFQCLLMHFMTSMYFDDHIKAKGVLKSFLRIVVMLSLY